MKIEPIDHKLHIGLTVLGLTAMACSFGALNSSLNKWADARSVNAQKTQRLEQIERTGQIERANITEQAKLAEHAAANNISQYSSIWVQDYVCDPNKPPSFDFKAMADPNKVVKVTDHHKLIVGELSPNGSFTFTPNNCTPNA